MLQYLLWYARYSDSAIFATLTLSFFRFRLSFLSFVLCYSSYVVFFISPTIFEISSRATVTYPFLLQWLNIFVILSIIFDISPVIFMILTDIIETSLSYF
jgi:hypothetical protein